MAISRRAALGAMGVALLAGCGSAVSARDGEPGVARTTRSAEGGPRALRAGSPLAPCADQHPDVPTPIDTSLARHFADNRVQSTISLDGGLFVATPPAGTPPVSAARARCNLLAGTTNENFSVLDAAEPHGLSFGLGVVTISPSVLRPGAREYPTTPQRRVRLAPFRNRLAWIAVVRPEVIASCPAMTRTPSSHARRPAPPPGYEVLAIDARSGAAGVIYSARSAALCGDSGVRPPSVSPLVEDVSEPWRLVHRTVDDATISYRRRSCDLPVGVTDIDTGRPVVSPTGSRNTVGVDVARVVTSCSGENRARLLLRSRIPSRPLPRNLTHQRVGALDVMN